MGGGGARCPKCHQPVDGDEAFICCADAQLQWHCEDCAKVSEGFAFPYGMCPHCGGRLASIDHPGVSDQAGLTAIRTAFEIELGGQAFYARAAEGADDPTLKELFGKFADMEQEHMAILSRRYHVALPESSDGFRLDIAAAQAGLDGNVDDPATLFQAAIAFEKRALQFFGSRVQDAPEGSVERQLYRELAAEEDEHVAILETEFKRWLV